MKKVIHLILIATLGTIIFNACTSSSVKNSISADPVKIASGETAFNTYCSGCHNFRQNGIGPQLSNITTIESAEWIHNFIKDPQSILQSSDKHAQALYHEYKTAMPSFNTLSDSNIYNIIAFLNTHHEQKINDDTANAIKDPIPEKIPLSNLVVSIKPFVQIAASSDSGKKPLARITKLDYQPTTKNIFIVDLRGKLYELENNNANVYLDIRRYKSNFINEPGLATGFGSFAFHPEFMKNGLFYTTHTEKPNSARADFSYNDSIKTTVQWVLTEWKADDPNASTFKGTSRELLRINMVTGIHGVQEICFNENAKPGDEDYGLLYIGIGDGGAAENGYAFLANSPQKIWGTILRIDPSKNNSANGKYGIPASNPFVKNKNDLGEIYAYGFRNPQRITWTSDGKMIVCNIGDSKIESIDVVQKGNDFGWPIREGKFVLHPYGDLTKIYPLPSNDSMYKITYPVAEYDHDEGKAICGGFEYTGKAIPALKGKFLFGDISTGRLFYINMKDIQQGKEAPVKEWQISINDSIKNLEQLCGKGRIDLRFGRDADGELYILTKADGKVYKIIDATQKP
ncbi:MAG: PQQ-dependent sugar dehydrogenase [Parafilimonas sp.]